MNTNSSINVFKLITRLQRSSAFSCANSQSRCIIDYQFDQHRHSSNRAPVPLMGLGKGKIFFKSSILNRISKLLMVKC